MVGHQFGSAAKNVCGLFIYRTYMGKAPSPWHISIWIDCNSVKKRHVIRDKLCEELKLPPEVELKWYLHSKKGKSFINLRKKTDAEEPDTSASTADDSTETPSDVVVPEDSDKKDAVLSDEDEDTDE